MKKISVLLNVLLVFSIISCGSPKKTDGAELLEYCGDENYKSPNNVNPEEAVNQLEGLESDWWKKSSFYHIWVKSFNNSNGATGNFKGIEEKLDYINNTLGCDAIWLSPVFLTSYIGYEETANMHGYNTTDYYSINYAFGQTEAVTNKDSAQAEEDLISLIKACHNRNMKIIFDYVPNHSSNKHKWFLDSINGGEKEKWYLWSSRKITTWNNTMNTNNWHYNETNGKYYYGAFGGGMPDLNYYNYEVREEMKNVVRFWLNKGFDGIRVDAIRYLMEEPGKYADTNSTHEWFKELRKELDKYKSPKFMVCENWVTDRKILDKAFGNNNEFNMVFDFSQGGSIISNIRNNSTSLVNGMYENPAKDTCYGIFLGNHDEYQERLGTVLDGDYKKIKLANALLYLRPNVPFTYYGQELGMKNLTVSGDLRLRGNFDWNLVDTELDQADSPLKLCKAMNTLRKKYSDVFADGKITLLTSNNGNFSIQNAAYILSTEDKKILITMNVSPNSFSTVNFSGKDLNIGSSYSCLIGKKSNPLTVEGDNITLSKVGPYSVRVYDLNESGLSNIYNDETYDAANPYTPEDVLPEYISVPSTMYLRGSMNEWGGSNPMTITLDNSSVRQWSVTINFSTTQTIEYKYCINGDKDWKSNWGESGGSSNIKATVAAGSRTFIFQFYKKTGNVSYSIK